MLRDYQIELEEKVFKIFDRDCKSLLVQLPTGTGKTTLFSSIIKKQITEYSPGKRVLILVHRRELVYQIYDRLRKFHLRPSKIISGEDHDLLKQVQVASIQTLIRKKEKPKNISLIVVDEAHHILSNTYRNIIEDYPTSKILGVTATPIRLNGEGFEEVFDKLICGKQIPWFIKNGYLANFKHYGVKTDNLESISVDSIKMDYNTQKLSELMSNKKVIGNVVDAIKKYAHTKKTIVFCVNGYFGPNCARLFGFIAPVISVQTAPLP